MNQVIEYTKLWPEIDKKDWPTVSGTICIMPTISYGPGLIFKVFEWIDPQHVEHFMSIGVFWTIEEARFYAEAKNTQKVSNQICNRMEVQSSNLNWIDYHDHDGSLIVCFKGGAQYRYKEVPRELFDSMRDAESKGRFLNQKIKPSFAFEKMAGKV